MAAKKKTAKTKRPPRQVWLLTLEGRLTSGIEKTRKAAVELAAECNKPPFPEGTYEVAGPYVLAERVRQR